MDRVGKGHYRFPSAGSMFKNDRSFGSPSGFLIDALGLRGFRIGDAGISTEHANIFINLGEASAKDMLALIDYTQKKVLKAYGFALEPEVLTIGDF
jgi:UDP-N-acetylmuramate dehydrogenase